MSDNPYRDLPEANLYAAPAGPAQPTNPLFVPAIVLLVLSIIYLLIVVLSLPIQVVRFSNVDASTPRGVSQLTGGIGSLVVWIAMSLAIIAGSICMLRLKGYSGAMTAAIVSVIPLCSPCFVLGIPFGIWAIVLLRRPDVRNRFT